MLVLLFHKWISKRHYSRLLVTVALVNAALMLSFHFERPASSAANLLHWIVVALAQYGIFALSLKIWLAINYKRLGPRAHTLLHSLSHGSLLLVLLGGFWMKANHSVILALVYPLAGMSVALIAESIEEQINRTSSL